MNNQTDPGYNAPPDWSRRWVAVFATTTLSVLSACGGGGGDGGATIATPLQAATAFLAAVDASFSTSTPTTAQGRTAFLDACYLNGGVTKQVSADLFNSDTANAIESVKYGIGSTRTNVHVLADRTSANPDGSARHEIDIQYQVNYTDGTVETDVNQTIISGSSFGSSMMNGTSCTTPQSGTNWRAYGDRSILFTSVNAVNARGEYYSVSSGAEMVVRYDKFIGFQVSDPSNISKYVVVKGPGLPPAGLKMVSPRITRDDPLFAGKVGNYVDSKDTDSFLACRVDATTGRLEANLADCLTFGTLSNTYGVYGQTAAAADSNFAALGFVAGGSYSVAIYNDDGWKTVNGQATRTPIATYTKTLNSLPYSAVTLAGSGVGADLYPRITSSLTPAQLLSNFQSKAPFTLDLGWTALGQMPDGARFGWGEVDVFESGRATATANTWPASRQNHLIFPANGATSLTNHTVPAPSGNLVTPTFGAIGIWLSNRHGANIGSKIVFQ